MARFETLDILGDMFGGCALLETSQFLAAFRVWSSAQGPCTSMDGTSLPPAAAVLINGYYAHALELDDTHDRAVLHAGASAVPAAFAAAELRGEVSGAELLCAVATGVEVTCRLGVATQLSLVEGGWIYSSLLAHFGAAVAACKILANSVEAIQRALGMAYVLTCGNHQSTREGAETKHLQPAIAGSHGVLAALLAMKEVSSPAQPFLGEDGLNRVYLRNRLDPSIALEQLGERWLLDELSFKPYPSCRLTHPPITAALALRDRCGADAAQVKAVRLRMGSQALDVVGRATPNRLHPERRLDAQFSAFWAVAVAMANGKVLPSDLVEQIPPTDVVAKWIGKIECHADDGPVGAREVGRCVLEVEMVTGERLTAEAAQAKGHPTNPMTEVELVEKFARNLALGSVPEALARELAATVLSLERHANAAKVLSDLAHVRARHAM
jgi:2-methylcitrate dehydratase PrpD